MAELSIRQFASQMNVSHNTIRNVMANYTKETGSSIGRCEGKGKPTYLSDDEQFLLAQRMQQSSATPSKASTSITTYKPTKLEVSKYQSPITQITYGTTDKGDYVATNIEVLENNLETVQANTESLDSALLAKYQSEGTELGFKLFEAKYGKAFQVFNDLEQSVSKKQNLTRDVA